MAALCELGGEHIQKYPEMKTIVAAREILVSLKKSLDEKNAISAGLDEELANLRTCLWAAQSMWATIFCFYFVAVDL